MLCGRRFGCDVEVEVKVEVKFEFEFDLLRKDGGSSKRHSKSEGTA